MLGIADRWRVTCGYRGPAGHRVHPGTRRVDIDWHCRSNKQSIGITTFTQVMLNVLLDNMQYDAVLRSFT